MNVFHIPQLHNYRNVYISVLNGASWGMEQVHCGICEIGLLTYDSYIKCNPLFFNITPLILGQSYAHYLKYTKYKNS